MKKSLTISVMLSLLCGLSGFAQTNLDSGLVAKYYFNGNANDGSGNGYHGTVNGATLTDDRFGNTNSAYYFDHNSINTISTQCPAILGSDARTISFWQTSDNTTQSISMSYGAGSSYPTTPGCTFVIFVQRINSNQLIAGVDLRYGGISYVIDDTTNDWNHYCFIVPELVQPRTADVKVYRNGILLTNVQSMWGDVAINTLSGLNFSIGQFINSANFEGNLDDIRIYNRAINFEEIMALYNEATSITETNNQNIELSISPNPNNGNFNISYELLKPENIEIQIFDALGRLVYSEKSYKQKGNYNKTIDLEAQADGIYFGNITLGENAVTEKIIIAR